MYDDLWAIVLAAGAGRGVAALTGGTPKQFWRPDAGSSLLEQTLLRLRPLADVERTVTVVDATHRAYLDALSAGWSLGEIVRQPRDRGTAAGALLLLAGVLACAPDPIVVIAPSDHGVEDAACFRKGIAQAIARIRKGGSDMVVFGVEPSTVESDFGWIMPAACGTVAGGGFDRVASLVDGTTQRQASFLFDSGALWNTMVVVARARALFDRCRRHLPFHVDVMTAAHALPAAERDRFLADWYEYLPAADFCRDVLAPSARDLCVYIFPAEMGWSDLGTPERLQQWLALERRPILSEALHARGTAA